MLFRLIYNDHLAQAAYLIGCQATGEAIVVDPARDVDRYIDAATKHGLRLVAATETHIHADFLSGTRELAERVPNLQLYLSGDGDDDWQYGWAGPYEHTLVHDGDSFAVGNIRFDVMHTPGHTPEHLCFLVTDKGGGADRPMGVLTGDFLFVGDMGRPDLLETAAGQQGVKEQSAERLEASARRFLDLPDYLQVWPAHGAGSACGKALGAVPQSTVGYERSFNPALALAGDAAKFVSFILEGQPEPPLYFGRMKVQNRDGVPKLGKLPSTPHLDAAPEGAHVVDTRPWPAFREGHLKGALHAPLGSAFHTVVGSYLQPGDPMLIVAGEREVEQTVRELVRIGLDKSVGYLTPQDLESAQLQAAKEIDVTEARKKIEAGEVTVLDVRRAAELSVGSIAEDAINVAHTRLPAHLDKLPKDRPLLVHCALGGRSAFATAYLRRAGYDAINLAGGFRAWNA